MTKEIIKSPFYILFVDDEDNARKYFEKGLKHEFNILTASSVDEATKIIEENHHNIAVVVTDQRMPGGNGVKLLRYLRENYPHIIRLLTTAYSDLTEAIDAVNSGEIFRYIQKPWDYNLLKTEMKQSIDLFELRLDHSRLLHEKIMVRKKMARIERAKSLLIAAKTFSFLRFSDLAIQNFIKKFAINTEIKSNAESDWGSFDFGRSDVLETKFLLNLIDKVQSAAPLSQDYSFNENIDSVKIKSLIEQENSASTQIKISNQIQAQVNLYSFSEVLKRLLHLASLGNGAIEIENSAQEIIIKLSLSNFSLPENENIFTQNPEKPAGNFYVNLLICYLLTWHQGGFIEIVENSENFNCIVKLPDNSVHVIFTDSQSDSLENTILSTMLS
ncbi:MAG: response regulator [Proteobacteria bacterium]|nr:response regulator [Pseudomonadota bacterium]